MIRARHVPRATRPALLILLPVLIAASLPSAPARAAAHGAPEPGERKKGGGLSFLQLPTLTANIARPNGARGVLTVEAGLDVADNGLRDRAESLQPRLRDAYVRFLSTYAATVPVGRAPDPEAIAQQLQRSTDLVLGKPGAKFLLGTVMVN